ncbi:MAG: glycosyltransferase family 39 protein [Candidatus Aureabacteria bacterium]|nr:glycosyltransferase family 39 protein [Candidatus Auribacterota bacterium]
MAHALKILLSFPLLFLAPGFFILHFLKSRGRMPASLDSRFPERLYFTVLTSVAVTSWIALILAQIGFFSLPAVCAILLAISLAFGILSRGAPWTFPRPPAGSCVIAALFACIGLFLYTPPYEYVLGIWDPGVYVNAGAHLARTGSIIIHDRILPQIPAPDRELFYDTRFYPQRYEGMAIADAEKGIISPHFYHLYIVWIGLFHAIGGLKFSLLVNTVFGLLSLSAFFLLGKELAGKRTAFLAALLLLFSAAQTWAVRFPTSEILAQFFLLSWLLCLLRPRDDTSNFWTLLGGVCFAEALLTVFTAVTLVPLFIVVIFWRTWDGSRRGYLLSLIPLGGGLLHLAIQDATVCRSYAALQFQILRSEGLSPALLLASALILLLSLLSAHRWMKRLQTRLRRIFGTAAFGALLGSVLIGLFAFAYYLRPLLSGAADVRNLRELGWFLYPLAAGKFYFPAGLYLALAGVLLFIRGRSDEKWGAFIFISLIASVILLHRKMIFPSYPWAMRRYMPLVYPSLIFFTAFALARLSGRKGIGTPAAVALAALLILPTQRTYGRYVRPTEFSGTIDFLGRLAGRLDRGGVYICEGSGMAAPLDCVYGLDMLHLRAQTPEKCRGVERVIGQLIGTGRKVYYISRDGWPISRTLNFIPLFSLPLRTDHLDYTIGGFSGRRVPLEIDARVFRVAPLGGSPEADGESRTTDIGEDCFGLIGGFEEMMPLSGKEGGKRVKRWGRWTRGEAEVVIPTFGSRNDLSLILRASAGRERPAAQVPVKISVDGKEVGILDIGRAWGEYGVTFPASALPGNSDRAVLKISCPVWNPPGNNPGGVGICIDWIRVAPFKK